MILVKDRLVPRLPRVNYSALFYVGFFSPQRPRSALSTMNALLFIFMTHYIPPLSSAEIRVDLDVVLAL